MNKGLFEGIKKLSDAVIGTLGPRGKNVILHSKDGKSIITKDGATVAKFFELEDDVENVGANIAKQASLQTEKDCGDGTTTSIVLCRAIFEEAQKFLVAGSSPIELKRGIDRAVNIILEYLKEISKEIKKRDDIRNVATISANGDNKVGRLVEEAIDAAGKDGAVAIEESHSNRTTIGKQDGFKFEGGYLSSQFVTDQRLNLVKYKDALVFVTDAEIGALEQFGNILNQVARDGRPLLIVANDVEKEALTNLIVNSIKGTLKVVAVKAPRYGEEREKILEDLCIATGATFINRLSGIRPENIKLEHLGEAKLVEIKKNMTTVVGGRGEQEKIDERIEGLKNEIKNTESIQECERIQERITRLASGVAMIYVGAATEIEMIEEKHRIEDSLEAVKSAQEEGLLPGGGTAFVCAELIIQKLLEIENNKELNKEENADLRLSNIRNKDQLEGIKIVAKAILEPIRQIAINAGKSPDIIVDKVKKGLVKQQKQEKKELVESYGYNAAIDEYVDMYESGVIDSAKVVKSAIRNAASVAGTLITSKCAIIEK